MALTVTEANAVFELLRWLAGASSYDGPVSDERAAEVLGLLADHAGQRLQVLPDRDLIARAVGRLRAADSDGAAQAVCEALQEHVRHGGAIPWPIVRDPFGAWQRAREAQGR